MVPDRHSIPEVFDGGGCPTNSFHAEITGKILAAVCQTTKVPQKLRDFKLTIPVKLCVVCNDKKENCQSK